MNDCRFGQPYSLFHSLDLDWILKEIKSLREEGLSLTALRDELRLLVGSDSETAKNSDALGGLPAENYLKKTETAADSNKLGGLPAADYLTKTTAANTYLTPTVAGQIFLQKAGTAADSNKLGGATASEYATKTYVADTCKPPVGAVLAMWNNTDPATLYANTSWELVAEGLCLIQSGNAYTLGSTGGESSHTLTMDEMPAHEGHLYSNDKPYNVGNAVGKYLFSGAMGVDGTVGRGWNDTASEIYPAAFTKGSGNSHNNMPPYLAVNWWKRIA